MQQKSTIANDFNQKGAEFLQLEVQAGITLANIALSEEPGSQERIKNQSNARKAYQTVLRLRDRIDNPDVPTNLGIQNGLDQLRSVLEKLGEKLR